jgi:hypothetical protein
LEYSMDAIQRRCLTCSVPFTAVSRRQKYCSQGCRPSSQNGSNDPIQRGAENSDLAALQPLENIDAELDHFQEFQTSRPRANSQKELHFEEWPPRVRMMASCISYKLTDGKQINTGYGRASSPHGYVMEISPGRWVGGKDPTYYNCESPSSKL